MKKPRLISSMSQEELVDIVVDIYNILFHDGSDYDAEKELGAGEIGCVVNVFARVGLLPVEGE